jgi:hypothetical protein
MIALWFLLVNQKVEISDLNTGMQYLSLKIQDFANHQDTIALPRNTKGYQGIYSVVKENIT